VTTDTEALRAQFEREIGEAAPLPVERDGDSYINRMCAWAWEGYQAGHAAAAAGTATPVAARWYVLTNDGMATLCADEADAKAVAADADVSYPHMAPHRAVQLVPASELAAAVANERDRCADIADQHASCEGIAQQIADAIRAGDAKEPTS